MTRSSLTVVGVGIQVPAHVTTEARLAIERADEVLYLVADPVAAAWIKRLNSSARPLHHLYTPGEDRGEAYAAMVEEILARVRRGGEICVAFYGHPGVFVNPSHEAIHRARDEGFDARMLPGISAEDCLFADLGVDPSESGCQSYEATDLLACGREIDPSAALILWQVGVVGNLGYAPDGDGRRPITKSFVTKHRSTQSATRLLNAFFWRRFRMLKSPRCQLFICRLRFDEHRIEKCKTGCFRPKLATR